MINALLVFISGGVGALLRYIITFMTGHLGLYVHLVPNLIGAFLIGVLTVHFELLSKELWLILVVGFLGGFTTFSGYIQFAATEGSLKSLYYILIHHVAGFGLFFIGVEFSKRILAQKV